MALIQCKECNNEISDKADTCPHCGIKVNEIRLDTNTNTEIDGKKALKILIGIILFLAGLGMFFNGLNNISNENKTQMSSIQLNTISKTNYDKIKNGMTEEEVRKILGNPSSSSETSIEGIGRIKIKEYRNWTKTIQIQFLDGKVYVKNWIET